MLLQEAVSYNLARVEKVYVFFLDIRKAFDTICIPGLLYKLYQMASIYERGCS